MARPREYDERVTTTVRLPQELLERLDAEAQRRDLGRNRLTIALLEWALPDYESEELP